MAPRRRVNRKTSIQSRDISPPASDLSALSEAPPEADNGKSNDKDSCPACPTQVHKTRPGEKDTWIQCDKCKIWFHWLCVGEGGDPEALQKWFCQTCREADTTLKPTPRPPARKSSRKRTQLDYANLHAGIDPTTVDGSKWVGIIETKPIKSDNFRRLKGSEVNADWLEQDTEALKEPIVIENPDGLGMRMPDKDFTVATVAEIVGPQVPVEVIDVASQSNSPNWNLQKWSEYYSQPAESRDKIRNVISLEFSNTPLADKVSPPRIVKELDWVEKFWPTNKKGPGQLWPKVQMYCLMGVARAWTDWHVDFAGSSVYYHIFRGSKIFYFIRPTPANLAAYERWSGTDLQTNTWLGDLVDEVVKVQLVEGNTMIIPTGWIHAVYTPIDSLVFGGNFLHSWNIGTQLRVREIEIATHVPKKFRFPLFTRLCWYAGEKYLRDLKAREDFPSRVLDSLADLADFLVAESRIIEARHGPGTPTEAARKDSKDAVPVDKVKDASALARELRWRVRNARGLTSGDEGTSKPAKRGGSVVVGTSSTNGIKRKRESVDVGEPEESENGRQIFRHWQRKKWEREESLPKKSETKVRRRRRPTATNGEGEELQPWLKDAIDLDDEMDQSPEHAHDEAVVETTTEIIVKVRRVQQDTSGEVLERQRVERRVEVYKWPNSGQNLEEVVSSEQKPLDTDAVSLQEDRTNINGDNREEPHESHPDPPEMIIKDEDQDEAKAGDTSMAVDVPA
ncbi:jumonji protein [Hysterangium stoloniferum]|nr:jumonji protein [Hysterangium stoloniferum]